jgi:Ca2+:H+ antiporter
MPHKTAMPASAWIFPIVALLFYAVASALGSGSVFVPDIKGVILAIGLVPVLFGAVFAAVHHAEVIAHRTGEPYGTLVLTASVTIIEVALITSVMLGNPDGSPELARDTVFAVVMIVCNG